MPEQDLQEAAELIIGQIRALAAKPSTHRIDADLQAGIVQFPGEDGCMERRHNGASTITIRINGGA